MMSTPVDRLLQEAESLLEQLLPQDALQRLIVASQADPNNSSVLDLLGQTYLEMGEPEKAKDVRTCCCCATSGACR